MEHLRTVADVMSRPVVSVDRGTAFKDIVETMRMWNIGVLPVLTEEGHVAGVVSEADLLLSSHASVPDRATTAERMMTRPAVTVPATSTIRAAARVMARRHLKRLPVVNGDGRLVGIVSRGDLLKVYLRPDTDIGTEVRELLGLRLIPRGSAEVHVHVASGVVHLHGSIPDAAMEDVLVRAVGTVPGVVAVKADFTATTSV